MSMEDQQQTAKVFVGAFLEVTFHGRQEYDALLRDFAFGAQWLPPAMYVIDFADSSMITLDSFDSGFDITRSTSGYITYSAAGFDRWTQVALPGIWHNSNRVLLLQWGDETHMEADGVSSPAFTMDFEQNTLYAGDRLYMSLGSGNANISDPNISFKIRLTDSSGHTAIKHIRDFGGVPNPINVSLFSPIFSAFNSVNTSEPILQGISVPTELFEGLNGEITRMEWIMEAFEVGQTLYVGNLRVVRAER